MAQRHKFAVRTGGMCNPGGIQKHMELSNEDFEKIYASGKVCGDDIDIINGKNIGAIRLSFGACSSIEEVTAFVDFVKEYYVNPTVVQVLMDIDIERGDLLRRMSWRLDFDAQATCIGDVSCTGIADVEKFLSEARLPRKLSYQSSKDTFAWKDVSYSMNRKGGKKTIILENICGRVRKGTLLGIMGPSGCGKTTLLNILSRRLRGTGSQTLSGNEIDDATLRLISTYVEQEDHLIGSLTVRETLDFAAKLALPGKAKARREITESMLRSFGLLSVKDCKI